jgi:hypothetical protein
VIFVRFLLFFKNNASRRDAETQRKNLKKIFGGRIIGSEFVSKFNRPKLKVFGAEKTLQSPQTRNSVLSVVNSF